MPRILANQFLISLVLLALSSRGSAKKWIHPSSPHCNHLAESLECDFAGIDEPVFLDSLEGDAGKQINKISVHNAVKLSVTGSNCVNLHLNSILQVNFIIAHNCHKIENLSLKVTKSKMNAVPKYIEILDMEDSSADWLKSNKKFKSLSVINSHIGTLNLDHIIGGDVIARFKDSTIGTIELLKLEDEAQLHIQNTKINMLKFNSIQLVGASANIWLSNVKTIQGNAVRLGEKSSMSLKDINGEITISSSQEMMAKPNVPVEAYPPGVPPIDVKLRRPRNSSSPLLWIIPTILAVVEAIIIMVNCTNWFPGLKSARIGRTVEDGRRISTSMPEQSKSSGTGYYYEQDSQSSIYFGNEDYTTKPLNNTAHRKHV